MNEQEFDIVDLYILKSSHNSENELNNFNHRDSDQINKQQCQSIMLENINHNKKKSKDSKQRQKNNDKEKEKAKVSKHWTEYEMKKYWVFLKGLCQQNKFVKTSWAHWKSDKFFIKMEQLFKKTKTHRQIKSFDQRMKKKYLQQKNIDLCEAIQISLKELKLTKQQQEQIQKQLEQYLQTKKNKKNVQLLEEQYKQINKKLQNDIQQQKIMTMNLKTLISQCLHIKTKQENKKFREKDQQIFYQ